MTTFTQTAKIGGSGSFFNQLMSNNSSVPVVGKGATEMLYSDRHVYEVIEVSKDGKTVKLEALSAVFGGEPGTAQMGHQDWKFEQTGNFKTIQWRHNAWRVKSEVIRFTPEYNNLLNDRSLTKEERSAAFDDNGDLRVVEGMTKAVTEWHKINIIFGRKSYYYDWSF